MKKSNTPPIVMCFSGFDPTGGAGITADIEALASQGCQSVGVITALTVQDSRDILSIGPIEPEVVVQQARAVLEDMPVAAFKLGLLGSEENISAIHSILVDYPNIPVVFDPVMTAGGSGQVLVDAMMLNAMINLLVPQTNVLTPNTQEILNMVPEADTVDAAAMGLLETGVEYILATGTDTPDTQHVHNTLYGNKQTPQRYTWPRLPHQYHGSGCTLAASLAGLLAQGVRLEDAIFTAQEYTWSSLEQGYRLGMGQYHPNRFYWASEEDESDKS